MAAIDTSQREANIYGAALALAPSYTSPEIWTTLNKRYVAGKPLSEHHQIARARSEYDNAVRMINLYDRMTIAGIAYEGEALAYTQSGCRTVARLYTPSSMHGTLPGR